MATAALPAYIFIRCFNAFNEMIYTLALNTKRNHTIPYLLCKSWIFINLVSRALANDVYNQNLYDEISYYYLFSVFNDHLQGSFEITIIILQMTLKKTRSLKSFLSK